MSTHFTRPAAALLIAVMLLTVFAGATLGATGPSGDSFTFAERGVTAEAVWESCDGPDIDGVTHCSATQVFVFDGRQRNNDIFGRHNGALTYLCVYRSEVAFDEDGSPIGEPLEEQGCIDDPELAVSRNLESVTAAAAALVLTRTICTYDPDTGEPWCEEGSSRTVDIEATFTGIGDVVSDRWSSRSWSAWDGARCMYSSSGSGISREATASMAIDGSPIDSFAYARLSEGKMRLTQKCR